MGTDYPYAVGEIDPIGFVEGSGGLGHEQRRLIFGGNAARPLGAERPSATASGIWGTQEFRCLIVIRVPERADNIRGLGR